MPKQQRPEGAAPLCSRDFYEKVNPFWLDQAARLEARGSGRKPQAWAGGPARSQGRKLDK